MARKKDLIVEEADGVEYDVCTACVDIAGCASRTGIGGRRAYLYQGPEFSRFGIVAPVYCFGGIFDCRRFRKKNPGPIRGVVEGHVELRILPQTIIDRIEAAKLP